ncbi:MAG TPA: hypothetical protein VKR58_01900, partial [Aquella sp.]|nr:hypothetical protein [Aquella sp.]
MIYFHLTLLLYSLIISSLCNAMNESDNHHLPLVCSFTTERDIIGIEFPTDDTVSTIHKHGWSTFCSKTGKQKINITNNDCISDFALNKNGKIAIVDYDNLTVRNMETGEIIYKKVMPGLKRVAFCSDNDTFGIHYPLKQVITIHTIGKDGEEQYTTPSYYMKHVLFVGNPTNKEFIIGDKIMKCVTDDKGVIITDIPGDITNMLSSHYNPDGTVIVIQRQDGYLFHKRDNQVHKKDNQYFVINSSKNSSKSHKYAPYYSIALHPKKRFAALLTDDNSIEFWDYTKETEKPLAIIELPSKDDRTADWYN